MNAGVIRGTRPDLTPAQLVALIPGLLPVIANVLRAFGVFDLNDEQTQALRDAIDWGVVLALGLIGGDAAIRIGRNVRDGKVEAAHNLAAQPTPQYYGPDPDPDGLDDDYGLPSDEDEFASPPPDDPDA